MTAPDMPTAFPFEGPEYAIPRTRPPRRYGPELDAWEYEQLAHAYAAPDRWVTGMEPEPSTEDLCGADGHQEVGDSGRCYCGLHDAYAPAPVAHKHGDPIMRAVTAAALVIMVVFLSAATIHGRYSPHVILGCFAAAILTAAIGWAAYAWADRKAVQ